jgi:2-aminoethylphosphonate-pyruvate transaminase
MAAIRGKLLQVFDIEDGYTSALISGSGTAALEMGVSACLQPDRSMLVIQNGVYGERIAKIAEVYGFKKHVLSYSWGELPSMRDLEQALEQHPDIEIVAMVHHETTTGLLNPLTDISRVARQYNKKLLVDCISSLAGDTVDFQSCPIDFAIGTANKCVQGLPGVSFVLFKKEDLPRLGAIPARSLYFNLFEHHGAQEKGDTLFTPAIQAHYALDEALSELKEETVGKRVDRYRANAARLREGFSEIGLEILIPEPHRSNCLTSLYLPGKLSYVHLHDQLKKEGFVIYAGQGNLSNRIFRIANMGDIRSEEIDRFLGILKNICSNSVLEGARANESV